MVMNMTNEEIIWQFLKEQGYTDAGCAGIMGNLYAESGLNPINLQNTFEKKLSMSDQQYCNAVDNGTYTNFIYDGAGWGIAQWTFWSRKEKFLQYVLSKNSSIGDLLIQLNFLQLELITGYSQLVNLLSNTDSVYEASTAFLLQFERPADQSDSMKQKRAAYAQEYYDKYVTREEGGSNMSDSSLVVYTKWSPNCSSPRNHVIDTISIHCMAANGSIESLGNLFAQSSRKASSNYGIGSDGRIGQYVRERDRSWCTSSSSNDNRAITIEVANDGGADTGWHVSDRALESLIDLLVDICQRNNIPELRWKGDKSLIGQVDKQNMTVHRWFAAKACPGDYLYNLHPWIADEVNARLGGDEDMTQEKFNEMMQNYLNDLAAKPADWETDAMNWAVSKGLLEGDEQGRLMPKKFMTRGEFMTVLQRYDNQE